MQTYDKSRPQALPRVCPFFCNHILRELLCSWLYNWYTPPTLGILFLRTICIWYRHAVRRQYLVTQ
jgi:hypothetical protein